MNDKTPPVILSEVARFIVVILSEVAGCVVVILSGVARFIVVILSEVEISLRFLDYARNDRRGDRRTEKFKEYFPTPFFGREVLPCSRRGGT